MASVGTNEMPSQLRSLIQVEARSRGCFCAYGMQRQEARDAKSSRACVHKEIRCRSLRAWRIRHDTEAILFYNAPKRKMMDVVILITRVHRWEGAAGGMELHLFRPWTVRFKYRNLIFGKEITSPADFQGFPSCFVLCMGQRSEPKFSGQTCGGHMDFSATQKVKMQAFLGPPLWSMLILTQLFLNSAEVGGGIKSTKIRRVVTILNFAGPLKLTPLYRDSPESPRFGGQKSKLSRGNFRHRGKLNPPLAFGWPPPFGLGSHNLEDRNLLKLRSQDTSRPFFLSDNLLKLKSLDTSRPFFLSDNRIWGRWTQMLQIPWSQGYNIKSPSGPPNAVIAEGRNRGKTPNAS